MLTNRSKDVQGWLRGFCKTNGIVIYANDSTHLVTVTTIEGVELFSFSSANSNGIEGLVDAPPVIEEGE